MAKLVGVTHDKIEKVWPHIEKQISGACKRSLGRFEADDIKAALVLRNMQLWLAYEKGIEAICVTEIVKYPQAKACRILIGTGKNRENWEHFEQTIGLWAKAQGCRLFEAFARNGWKPSFKKRGWKSTHCILERIL